MPIHPLIQLLKRPRTRTLPPKQSISGRGRSGNASTLIQRARTQVASLTPDDMLTLQRTIGNQAVQRLITDQQAAPQVSGSGSSAPLADTVQMKMEDAFQTDFSNVRVHTASHQALRIGADAYTQGNQIHFAPGKYNPQTRAGQQLLGHEITHVVQQRQNRVQPNIQMQRMPVNTESHLEHEAHQAGARAERGEQVSLPGRTSPTHVTQSTGPHAPVQRFQHLMDIDEFQRQKQVATNKKSTGDIKKLYGKYSSALKKQDYVAAKNMLDSLGKKYARMSAKKTAGMEGKGKDYWKSVDARSQLLNRLSSDLSKEEGWLQDQVDSQLFDTHVKAYKDSRYYHLTKQTNVASIMNTGLDPNFGGSNAGLSDAIDNEEYKKNSSGHVHVANYWVSKSMEKTLTDKNLVPEYLRAFVGKDQKEMMRNDQDMMGYAPEAWKTKEKIDPDAIYSQNVAFTTLPLAKQRTIAGKIREHYPSPPPSIDDVVRIHTKCLANHLLFSDHPFAPQEDTMQYRRYSM